MSSPFRETGILLLLSSLVCLLVAAMSFSMAFNDLNYWTYDFLVTHGGFAPQSRNVVMVDLDDATVAQIRQFPIPRDVVAHIITKVASAKPRVIGLDMLLSEERKPEQDAAMAAALTKARNVVASSQAASGGLPAARPLPIFCDPEESDKPSGFCKEGSPGALGYAFTNMPIDSDGFLRQFFLLSTGPRPAVSFPVFLAQQFAGQSINSDQRQPVFLGRLIPYAHAEQRTVLVGSWSEAPAKHISAAALIGNTVDLDTEFADKLVLIGQSSDAARDRHFTPLFRKAGRDNIRIRLSGTDILAASIETLLTGRAIRIIPTAFLWSINFGLVLIVSWLVMKLPLKYSLIIIFGGIVLLYGAAQLLLTLRHEWFQFLSGQVAVLASLPAVMTYQFIRERFWHTAALAEREQVMGLFSRYVSPEAANQIWQRRGELVLAGEERVATVLFSDIRNFTQISAGKPSGEVLQWLSEYFTAMDEVITEHGGFLNKFIGDGLMVLFGVPLSEGVEQDAVRSLKSAIKMIERVADLNHLHRGDCNYPGDFKIGVGIHTGLLTCGSVGSTKRLEYSVIGETVNLASRLESATKEFNTEIVMSAATYELVRQHFCNVRALGSAVIKGLKEAVVVYGLDVTHNIAPAEANAGAEKSV